MQVTPVESRGVAFRGTVWAGGTTTPYDGAVVVDDRGRVAAIGPGTALPEGLRVLGGEGYWVGPGLVDAHVHLAFGDAAAALRGGVVAVRDLGAPLERACAWRSGSRPAPGRATVSVAGPVVTAPDGYPSQSWGADGFAMFLPGAETARTLVDRLAAAGVDVVKVALEPAGGAPVVTPAALRALVDAAHARGLPVTAHALTVGMVRRALDAHVDELAHTPVELLPDDLVDRIAATGIPVVSTLQCLIAGDRSTDGAAAAANAAALHSAGVALLYGTDLGNTGTRPGADPRELDRLADAGLGRAGALRAATEGSAAAAGIRAGTGRLEPGGPAALVLLAGDPLDEPAVWLAPTAVCADGYVVLP
ncbi:MAG: amidohydrolase family protein [Pseudonocardiales bacterium]